MIADKSYPNILWSIPTAHSESDCACAEEHPPVVLAAQPSPATLDSDCACAEALPSTPSASLAAAARWQRPAALYRAPLADNYEVCFNPLGGGVVAALNTPALARLERFALPHPLTDATERQLATLGLLTPVDGAAVTPATTSPTLTAWLHLTDACTLRCTYCYVRQRERDMDAATGRAAVEAIVRAAETHGFRAVKLKYAGGEPTLRWPLVRTLHAHAQTLTAQHNLGLHATVLSNGTLLTATMLDWLVQHDVRLMISLDGIGAVHDAQRPFADGRGSFTQVARNIDRALRRGLTPYLSITVTAQNVEHVSEVVAFAVKRDLLFNLNFVRAPHTAANLAQPDEQQRWISGLQAAMNVIAQHPPRRRLIDGLLDRCVCSVPHVYPCGAGRNYLVIDPQGAIAGCQMLLDTPVSHIRAADPLTDIRHIPNFHPPADANCAICPWRNWCAGGCPLLRDAQGHSPYCPIYRALFPELLRLEGLRLLKWGTAS